MMGFIALGWPFMVLIFFALIALFIIAIVVWIGRKKGKHWGRWVACAFLLFVFWDLLPVRGLHYYHCETEAGFFLYQTLDSWKAENPGVAETLEPLDNASWIYEGTRTRVPLNQRFEWVYSNSDLLLGIRKREDRIVDIKTSAVLARYIDFSSGMSKKSQSFSSPRGYKMWLNEKSCDVPDRLKKIQFNGYKNSTRLIRNM